MNVPRAESGIFEEVTFNVYLSGCTPSTAPFIAPSTAPSTAASTAPSTALSGSAMFAGVPCPPSIAPPAHLLQSSLTGSSASGQRPSTSVKRTACWERAHAKHSKVPSQSSDIFTSPQQVLAHQQWSDGANSSVLTVSDQQLSDSVVISVSDSDSAHSQLSEGVVLGKRFPDLEEKFPSWQIFDESLNFEEVECWEYTLMGGVKRGPCSLSKLRCWLDAELLSPEIYVRHIPTSFWRPVQEVLGQRSLSVDVICEILYEYGAWEYVDAEGVARGPFSTARMKNWFDAGMLRDVGFIREHPWQDWLPMGEIVLREAPFSKLPVQKSLSESRARSRSRDKFQ